MTVPSFISVASIWQILEMGGLFASPTHPWAAPKRSILNRINPLKTEALSYRNQSIDLLRKSMDWFLYDNGLHYERVKRSSAVNSNKIILQLLWGTIYIFIQNLYTLPNYFLLVWLYFVLFIYTQFTASTASASIFLYLLVKKPKFWILNYAQ